MSGKRDTGERIGPYLLLRDQSGLRHLARMNLVSLVSKSTKSAARR